MHNYDDINFECRECGELKYRAEDLERIKLLTKPQALGGMGMPTCPVCGKVSIQNNGGYVCLECSSYYEQPNSERSPEKIVLFPRRAEVMPTWLAAALVIMAIDLVIAGAVFFGGWQI